MSLSDFVDELAGAWGSWAPTLSPTGDRIAYLSDRSGTCEPWVQGETGAERGTLDNGEVSAVVRQRILVTPRPDAELDSVSADGTGQLVLMNWHIAGGGSELELRDTSTGRSRMLPDPDGRVISGAAISESGSIVAIALESPIRPREIWSLTVESMIWHRVSEVSELPSRRLVRPTMEFFYGPDGYPLTGLLYRPTGEIGTGPVVITLPVSPEAPERPTFHPDHQAMVAAGISVFAPHIRGWSGLQTSITDTVAARDFLLQLDYADPDQVALNGRGQGSSLAQAVIDDHPGLFTAAVLFELTPKLKKLPTPDIGGRRLELSEGDAASHHPEDRRRLIQQQLDFFASLW